MKQRLPDAFGKYKILDRVATGTSTEVYKARIEGIGGFQRTFAIKCIRPGTRNSQHDIDLLVDEARVAGLLSHANIVQILDLGKVNEISFIAMEYVDGTDLGAILTRCREKGITLPVPHALFIAIELLKGLEYAHVRQIMRGGQRVPLQIVHRDLAPDNILISHQGEVKLTDFGSSLAAIREVPAPTNTGDINYMSPEHAQGTKTDARSDLFGVSICLYQMLAGQHPFQGGNAKQTKKNLLEGKLTPLSKANPEVPIPLQLAVDQGLQVAPKERFQTATAMKEALDLFFHDAGFIFTHAALGSFLKGLLAQEESAPSKPTVDPDQETLPFKRPAPTRPTGADQTDAPPAPTPSDQEVENSLFPERTDLEQVLPAPDPPTRPHRFRQNESSPLTAPQSGKAPIGTGSMSNSFTTSLLISEGDEGKSASFGPVIPQGDDNTVIRPGSGPDGPAAWPEIATEVRSSPGIEQTQAGPNAQDVTRTSEPLPGIPMDALDRRTSPLATRPPDVQAIFQQFNTTAFLYPAAAFVGAMALVLAGFLLGSSVKAPKATEAQPDVRIELPSGAQLYVDGERIDQGTTPEGIEGRPRVIRIEVDGQKEDKVLTLSESTFALEVVDQPQNATRR